MVDEQDAIVYKEQLIKRIEDPEALNLLEEDNYSDLMDYLLAGPMTFNDIKRAFEEDDNPKSNKTIYGYLHDLRKGGLVMEAGRRVITKENQRMKTLTLYARTARVYYGAIDMEERESLTKLLFQIFSHLFGTAINMDTKSNDCLKKLYDEFTEQKRHDTGIMNDQANEELWDLLGELSVREAKYVIDIACIFSFIFKKEEFREKLIDCVMKNK
ncbi:MAG: hypothetical protein GF308_08685 [Candidatus Heimdallarchaeota archaeon]|nr:hypothetical protein [Candidatus Heimdallarchaeota archaeon]